MSQRLSDWRGSSTRFLEAEETISNGYAVTATLMRQVASACEKRLPDGSVKCRFLSLARLHWQTFIPKPAGKSSSANARGTRSYAKTGVDLGKAFGVRLTAGCRECRRHVKLSTTLPSDLIGQLSWKSLELKPPVATFISWRVEVSNSYQAGSWDLSNF